jgi:hypothetical protein
MEANHREQVLSVGECVAAGHSSHDYRVQAVCQLLTYMYNRLSNILEIAVKTALRISVGLLSIREVTRWRW